MIATLHHYALEVPDLAVAEGFLQDFGLETGEKDGSLVAQCPGRGQEQVRMVEAPAKRLHHVSFTLHPGTLDSVQEALERSGTPVTDPPPGAAPDGLWIRDPDGTAVQLLAEEPSPPRPVARGADQHGRGPSADRHRLVAAGHRGRDAAAAGAHPAVHRAAGSG